MFVPVRGALLVRTTRLFLEMTNVPTLDICEKLASVRSSSDVRHERPLFGSRDKELGKRKDKKKKGNYLNESCNFNKPTGHGGTVVNHQCKHHFITST